MSLSYENGIAPIVTACGSGNLHHLSYNSNNGQPNYVGKQPVPTGTDVVLGFSLAFLGYGFYWDGTCPAFWHMAGSDEILPVGTSWTNATLVPWGSTEIVLGGNVQAQANSAVVHDNIITVYFTH